MVAVFWRRFRERPYAVVLVPLLFLWAIGLTWGLPSTDAWDEDGIAPRDILTGIYNSYRPGHYHTYPLLHFLLLGLLTLPKTIAFALSTEGAEWHERVQAFIDPGNATTYATVARCVSMAMAAGIVLCLSEIARVLAGNKAAAFTALLAGTNVSLVYYAKTSNLDVPYLFWSSLAVLEVTRALSKDESKRVVRAFLFAALGVATKDQAYALFLLSFPVAIVFWIALAKPDTRRAISKHAAFACVVGLVVLLLLDGAIFNPSGFSARIRFLLGPANQDHTMYPASIEGRYRAVTDAIIGTTRTLPGWMVFFLPFGILSAWRKKNTFRGRIGSLLPLLVSLSFLLFFTATARRTDHRFVLPIELFLCPTLGIGVATLWDATNVPFRLLARLTAIAGLTVATTYAVRLDLTMLRDPRYEVEALLQEQVALGERVELYGTNVHLPRLPEHLHADRFDSTPLASRSPLPRVTERSESLSEVEARCPTWIVTSSEWLWRFPPPEVPGPGGSEWEHRYRENHDTRLYLSMLQKGELAYALARVARVSGGFEPYWIHGATNPTIYVWKRTKRCSS